MFQRIGVGLAARWVAPLRNGLSTPAPALRASTGVAIPLLAALLVVIAIGCAGGRGTGAAPAEEPSEPTVAPRAAAASGEEAEVERIDSGPIPFWEGGRQVGSVSHADAARRGLTVLDLGEEWTPRVFAEDESLGARGRQPYRARFIELANEEDDGRRPPGETYLELFGIFPTFHVLAHRLGDTERHACHDAIDDGPIEALERSLRPNADGRQQRRTANAIRHLTNRLEREARRRRLESIDELADNRTWGAELRRLRELEAGQAGTLAVQAHLRCDGLLRGSRVQDGVLDAYTTGAIRAFQSKHMIIALGASVDDATQRALVTDSRELDFLSVLRTLRERVVSASGLLEDGTASKQWGTVVDRRIDIDDEFHWVDRLDPLPNGAPDLISPATDAAARALGWTSPEATAAWLARHAGARTPHRLVAVRLPPPPAYHSDHMDLRVEIDRGDVWYAFPYTDDGRPRGGSVRRRPLTTIFVRHEGRDIPLVRWNTTIGSWQPEINPEGGVGLRYKESDVGPRVWRDLIASPAWLPPPSTPDDELINGRPGSWRVNQSITGPGYDSAYGMAMVIHHLVRDNGEFQDRGIRSHGSVSYRTILRGYSHGCHRLFNHLAVRMTSFLLEHRNHTVRGKIAADFRRNLQPEDGSEPLTLEIDTRGYLFELTPPVPVEVLRGNVRGNVQRAPTAFFPLPSQLQAAARAALEADPGGSGVEAPAAPAPTAPAP